MNEFERNGCREEHSEGEIPNFSEGVIDCVMILC